MLSILIPTYNFAPKRLVTDLCKQAATLDTGVEVIVLDDNSTDELARKEIRELEAEGRCRVLWMPQNVGRARARNILYRESKGELLLFIDSDAEIVSSNFLAQHLTDSTRADVVCGRLTNPQPPAPKGCELRYKYEIAAESKGKNKRTADYRNRKPYDSLSTFQLLIHRYVMQQVRFDESISHYGYEDVLFGFQLKECGFSILHTDNPLLHTGINPNHIFLANTETALRTLKTLPHQYQKHITVSKMAWRLQRLGLRLLVRWIYSHTARHIKTNLLSKHPSLLLFAFYKVGYFLSLPHKPD